MVTRINVNARVLVCCLLLVTPLVFAQYKCVGGDGKTVYQDAPCAQDSKQTAIPGVARSEPKPTTGRGNYKAVEPNMALVAMPQAKPLLDMYRRWYDAEKLATSTARIALSGPVANLQALQREIEALQVPECMATAKVRLTDLVAKTTETFIGFMGRDELTPMVYRLIHRDKLVPDFERAVTTANCGPTLL